MAETATNPGQEGENQSQNKVTPRIIVQSDAYYLMLYREKRREAELLNNVSYAAREGYTILKDGGTAVDAVEKAICILEDNKYFNAGTGSLLNKNGEVECDAMIMDGETLSSGAVMAAQHFRNPVKISRKIMEKSPHCALTGEGALKFDEDKGLSLSCDAQNLKDDSPNVRADFKNFVKEHFSGNVDVGKCWDTVTAIALDSNGRFACGTSTGGIPGKLKGRVGDAPLVGCGGYANKFGAATAGGHGESLIKMTLARNIIYKMEKEGQDAQKATENALEEMKDRVNGFGCAIAIDKTGKFGKATNSPAMLWASIANDKISSGFERRDYIQ